MKTIDIFCANEQAETPHQIEIDGVGEVILTCLSEVIVGKDTEEKDVLRPCGRFLKFPKGTNGKDLKEYIATHKNVNEGQVSVESIEKAKQKLIDELEL